MPLIYPSSSIGLVSSMAVRGHTDAKSPSSRIVLGFCMSLYPGGFLEICKNKKNIFSTFFFLKKVLKIKKVF